jgi:hypothetical protein
MLYLPDCKFIFKGTSPYGDVIFINNTSRVMSLYATLDIKNTYILSYKDDEFIWIPIYIYNKKSKTFTCEKNARLYYDIDTKEIGILNNKYHRLDVLNTSSAIKSIDSSENLIARLIYFFFYSSKLFDIRYSMKQKNKRLAIRSRKSLMLIDDFINKIKLKNRFDLKLFVNNIDIDIYRYIDIYKDFCLNGINHSILLSYVINSLMFLNINYKTKVNYDNIIFKQLHGIEYNNNFKHFDIFTLNDKSKKYKYFKVATKNNMQLTNLIVYSNNYLLRLIDVRE